jgi:predicted DNA-binding antitoxin AbrB/MazE fold protein
MVKFQLRDVMVKTIEATYENGVFKPKEPIELEDKAEVCLTFESKPRIYDDNEDPTGKKTVNSYIGFIKNAPEGVPIARDHDRYLYEE